MDINISLPTIIVKTIRLYNNSYLENGEVVVLNDNDEIIIGRTSYVLMNKTHLL